MRKTRGQGSFREEPSRSRPCYVVPRPFGGVVWGSSQPLLDFFFFKQKTAYEMSIGDWSSDVCSSDLRQKTHTRCRLVTGVQTCALPIRSEEHTSELQSPIDISYAVSLDRKSTRLNSSHQSTSRMPSSARKKKHHQTRLLKSNRPDIFTDLSFLFRYS